MKWLFWQTWMLLLLSFLLGAFVTWLFLVRPLTRVTTGRTPAETPDPARKTDVPAPIVDLDTPAMGFAAPRLAPPPAPTPPVDKATEPAERPTDEHADETGKPVAEEAAGEKPAEDAFPGNADDTVVIAAEVAAGRPTEAPEDAPAEASFPGAALPMADGSAPTEAFVVKGNVDSMLYHDPKSPSYQQIAAQVWFRDEDAAENAGFRPWNWRARTTGGIPRLDASGPPVAAAEATDAADAAEGTDVRPVFEVDDELDELDTTSAPDSAMQGLAVEAVRGPYGPGSAAPRADGSAPSEEYRIKGNGGSKLYHTTDSPYFGRTRAEAWFRTEADAQRAGFVPWNRKARQNQKTVGTFEDGPYPGSARPRPGGGAPTEEFTVKADEDSKRYHTRESPFFGSTRAEVWFRSEADARRAGFAAWHTTASHA